MPRDFDYYGLRVTRTLGLTSVWMLIPASHAVCEYPVLAASLVGSCCASLAFWHKPEINQIKHKLDRACALLFCILLMMHSTPTLNLIFFPPVAVFFVAAMCAFQHRLTVVSFALHLMFRYVFYWWAFVVIMEGVDEVIVVAHSAIYTAHIVLVYAFPIHYWAGAVTTILAIVFVNLHVSTCCSCFFS